MFAVYTTRMEIGKTFFFKRTRITCHLEQKYYLIIGNKRCIVARGGSGGGYLSTARGTGTCHFLGVHFLTITELWVSFSQFFDISRNYGCPFQGLFNNFRNYGPDTYSICGIMALKSTRIHGIMGTDFLGKMARPRHIIGRVTPRASDEQKSSNIEKRSFSTKNDVVLTYKAQNAYVSGSNLPL